MAGVLTLERFLQDGAARPFEWGVCDCSLWPADWVLASTGIDPVPDLRGAYRCWIGAFRQIRRAGGLPYLYAARAAAIGMRATRTPIAGDVGVVIAPNGPVAAIRTESGRWAVKRERGVILDQFSTLGAWTFG